MAGERKFRADERRRWLLDMTVHSFSSCVFTAESSLVS
ncbi:uncharacterized protein FIBRA_09032 [Fibroporia radiculosa]|uniref:Uncharacterized protein n=1 Tax=Fibroporia radiculosa TaxID=599839 RepID=J4GIR1_9APHY|nr:uncharacterized protein FIBRA_09032 [Fibroporia radiculosa]CCM06738.1 predicted protein [Fibroporia radiculosa]